MFKGKAALRLTRSAQTSPARRLTTSLRLLRSSDRFLQSHISRLSPSPESVLQPSAPLPVPSQTEVLLTKQAENVEVARLVGYWLRKAFRPRLTSGSYIFINFRHVKPRKQPHFKKNSAGMERSQESSSIPAEYVLRITPVFGCFAKGR